MSPLLRTSIPLVGAAVVLLTAANAGFALSGIEPARLGTGQSLHDRQTSEDLRLAQSAMPSGPYKSWSEPDKQRAANTLKHVCNAQCSRYANTGGVPAQRALYEAAACTAACFASHLPADYPGLDGIRQSAMQNYNQAKQLGSPMPVPTIGH